MQTGSAQDPLSGDQDQWKKGQAALAERLAGWRAEPEVASVLAGVERFGAGRVLEHCGSLADLFSPGSPRAHAFASGFVAVGVGGLGDYPLGQLPLMHGKRDAVPTLVLASAGRASLALAAYDGVALEGLTAPKTAKFAPQETWIHVLSGSGEADLVLRRDGEGGRAVLRSGRLDLMPGMAYYRYGLREALHVRRVTGSLVLLRLQRQLVDPEPTREYSLPDGALVHQAAARLKDSRRELAMALLGRMGRKDAVTQMARIASGEADPEAGEGFRWQALREVLALDSAAGFQLLARISAREDDPLAKPAASLQASLLEAWPNLGKAVEWPR
ncbi:hypothetical protein [Novosphingobium mangrovi (ex Huang et al. 2023)]|uniref:Uncharacterized protein n=1 Tax=Novosphingobium mangrovi (ex Huang et al. 2023) TaxID=2976432 RepID=A0ABT2I0G7_9SPHN|nr:hypothetical protein [Novosphingobium mangrovi (ex Huang et al. 2023)]MCT2398300.1 hypothetical protein [Novosphingobium mangrovi (ex Huang et al. 2023)]